MAEDAAVVADAPVDYPNGDSGPTVNDGAPAPDVHAHGDGHAADGVSGDVPAVGGDGGANGST